MVEEQPLQTLFSWGALREELPGSATDGWAISLAGF